MTAPGTAEEIARHEKRLRGLADEAERAYAARRPHDVTPLEAEAIRWALDALEAERKRTADLLDRCAALGATLLGTAMADAREAIVPEAVSLATELRAAASFLRNTRRVDLLLDASRLDECARRSLTPEVRKAFEWARKPLREEADAIVDNWIADLADPAAERAR